MPPSDKKYRILFTGKLLPGRDPAAVAQQIRKHFPNGDRLIGLLSTKRAAVLKKNASMETARKIKNIGARCGIVLAIQQMEPAPTAPRKATSPAPHRKPPAIPAEMATCPWCGHWQAVAENCRRCKKPLAGTSRVRPASQPPVRSTAHPPGPERTFREKFRSFRIVVLSIILVVVGFASWNNQQDSTDWEESLHVVVYPINGDGNRETSTFIKTLNNRSFNGVEIFFEEQAESYGIELSDPFFFSLAPEVKAQPPAPPENPSVLNVMWWSLQLRYWVFTSDTYEDNGPPPDIRMFVVYHEPTENIGMLDSLGLQKSRTGIVHAFAEHRMRDQNKVVIAHEVMHTLGATDKYSMQTLKPDFPDGFAAPQQKPLYPQTHAEIMGSRIPITPGRWEMPSSLDFVVIGEKTATEIRWMPSPG